MATERKVSYAIFLAGLGFGWFTMFAIFNDILDIPRGAVPGWVLLLGRLVSVLLFSAGTLISAYVSKNKQKT